MENWSPFSPIPVLQCNSSNLPVETDLNIRWTDTWIYKGNIYFHRMWEFCQISESWTNHEFELVRIAQQSQAWHQETFQLASLEIFAMR